ncbi:conserved hypothetical protein [Sideroxydans lithotrophicus ES-1]|uniref:Uncharacterized protein n=1 Tax=Sideroxydans lithotrophicus (strain ES-1) TaxID=580332 RepID=D5CTB0_SIDLE|nr:conserved hypothetical protein [Sideroxydans lithotrophicus ES-1]
MNPSQHAIISLLARQAVKAYVTHNTQQQRGIEPIRSNPPVQNGAGQK